LAAARPEDGSWRTGIVAFGVLGVKDGIDDVVLRNLAIAEVEVLAKVEVVIVAGPRLVLLLLRFLLGL
jgi:hypothetical protein